MAQDPTCSRPLPLHDLAAHRKPSYLTKDSRTTLQLILKWEHLAITRIGLRYINRIERKSAEDHPGDWLRANEYMAPVVLRSAPAFLSRVEAHLDTENRIIVTLGDQPPAETGGYDAIIFDIDRIIEREPPPEQNV